MTDKSVIDLDVKSCFNYIQEGSLAHLVSLT